MKSKQSHKTDDREEGEILDVVTMRFVLNDTSYAVAKKPVKKRILVNTEKIELRDGEFLLNQHACL